MVIPNREFSPIVRGTPTIQVDDLYDTLSGGRVWYGFASGDVVVGGRWAPWVSEGNALAVVRKRGVMADCPAGGVNFAWTCCPPVSRAPWAMMRSSAFPVYQPESG